MENKNNITISLTNIVSTLIIVAGLIAIAYFGGIKIDTQQKIEAQQVKNQAVDECSKTAIMSWKSTKDSMEGTQINKSLYDFCMKEKGY